MDALHSEWTREDDLEGGSGGRKEKDAGVNGRGTDELALARSDGQSERGVAKLNQISNMAVPGCRSQRALTHYVITTTKLRITRINPQVHSPTSSSSPCTTTTPISVIPERASNPRTDRTARHDRPLWTVPPSAPSDGMCAPQSTLNTLSRRFRSSLLWARHGFGTTRAAKASLWLPCLA